MSKRVGILTGGGDVPGLNAAIKQFVVRMAAAGYEVLGLRRLGVPGVPALGVRILQKADVAGRGKMIRDDPGQVVPGAGNRHQRRTRSGETLCHLRDHFRVVVGRLPAKIGQARSHPPRRQHEDRQQDECGVGVGAVDQHDGGREQHRLLKAPTQHQLEEQPERVHGDT